jgi:hypothetical protein
MPKALHHRVPPHFDGPPSLDGPPPMILFGIDRGLLACSAQQ